MLHAFAFVALLAYWLIKINVEMLQLPEDSIRPPAIGSSVQVRWVDGQLYSAVFRGINNTSSVEVQHLVYFLFS